MEQAGRLVNQERLCDADSDPVHAKGWPMPIQGSDLLGYITESQVVIFTEYHQPSGSVTPINVLPSLSSQGQGFR